MLGVRLWLVTGPGGCRMDFVAGWLGKLPNFVDSNWCIDPVTGQSTGTMQQLKFIDQRDYQLTQLLSVHSLRLDSSSNTIYAGTCHGSRLGDFQSEIAQHQIKIIRINPGIDVDCIRWEFFVKTYLTMKRDVYSLQSQIGTWAIDFKLDPSPANIQRVAALDQVIRQGLEFSDIDYSRFPCVQLDYDRLFVPGGSQYLCQQLELTADSAYHNYWNHQLLLAKSPDELEVWGHCWRKQDYFN